MDELALAGDPAGQQRGENRSRPLTKRVCECNACRCAHLRMIAPPMDVTHRGAIVIHFPGHSEKKFGVTPVPRVGYFLRRCPCSDRQDRLGPAPTPAPRRQPCPRSATSSTPFWVPPGPSGCAGTRRGLVVVKLPPLPASERSEQGDCENGRNDAGAFPAGLWHHDQVVERDADRSRSDRPDQRRSDSPPDERPQQPQDQTGYGASSQVQPHELGVRAQVPSRSLLAHHDEGQAPEECVGGSKHHSPADSPANISSYPAHL